MLMEQGRPQESYDAYRLLVDDAIRILGDDHWMTAVFKLGLGRSLTSLERYDEACTELVAARDVLLPTPVNVHFTEEGSRELGYAVADWVRVGLGRHVDE